uniref:Uncharacterized protein n=1 Tax=Anguilla anguilla TaxID=7936 RepID=A0A0E9SNS2_ANGAN
MEFRVLVLFTICCRVADYIHFYKFRQYIFPCYMQSVDFAVLFYIYHA